MAVTDYKYAGTAANVDRDSKTSWNNYDYAKADDTSYATNGPNKSTYSDWLQLTNFGFTSDDIPSGATIDGIEFVICAGANVATDVYTDSAVYLRCSTGQVGSNMASATYWKSTPSEHTAYGGATNKCGWTGASQSEIVASTFGIDFSIARNDQDAQYYSCDYIKIRVYYTEGGGASLPLKNVFGRPFSGVFR